MTKFYRLVYYDGGCAARREYIMNEKGEFGILDDKKSEKKSGKFGIRKKKIFRVPVHGSCRYDGSSCRHDKGGCFYNDSCCRYEREIIAENASKYVAARKRMLLAYLKTGKNDFKYYPLTIEGKVRDDIQ